METCVVGNQSHPSGAARNADGQPHSHSDVRENERLEAIDRLDLLDAPRNPAFECIVRVIKNVFDVPIALVSVLDAHRQLYMACQGLGVDQTDRRNTFCTHAILASTPTIVPDATQDPRFANNPHVVGEPNVRFYAGVPLRTSDGHNIGTVCAIDTKPRPFSDRDVGILQDLADLAISQIELQQLATVDALTGALSRRAFRTSGERALALAQRHKYNLSLITFDIDHFKSVNDTHGHAAGDQVLAGVVAACLANLRQSDLFGRIGGEEFALLLPHTDRHAAVDVAEKLRSVIAGQRFELGGVSRQVTASFGVSTLDIVSRTIDSLLAHADSALYEAKADGRNRVVAWRSRQSPERHVRRRVLKAGLIYFNARMPTIECTVRTLAEDGAGLDLSSSYGLPIKFHLAIRSDGIDVPCRIVSRNERHVEVEFC
ncbi:sensor domain-containing diguanylate cyclase [Mesorhizobium sp. ASY16-5R]|uniref:sensor domain-containing diguanylate cyclase n=1 Tax=Mesorhizobium sp. ASY16-5R TaxID=3445772 RepID=UPI003F9EDAE7